MTFTPMASSRRWPLGLPNSGCRSRTPWREIPGRAPGRPEVATLNARASTSGIRARSWISVTHFAIPPNNAANRAGLAGANAVDAAGNAFNFNQNADQAAASMNCTVSVPATPLTAAGLASPWVLGDGCTWANGGTEGGCLSPDDHVDSVLALDMTTGAVKWAKRLRDSDDWNTACFTDLPGQGNCPAGAGPVSLCSSSAGSSGSATALMGLAGCRASGTVDTHSATVVTAPR